MSLVNSYLSMLIQLTVYNKFLRTWLPIDLYRLSENLHFFKNVFHFNLFNFSLIKRILLTWYLCIYGTAKKPNFPERFRKESEYADTPN